MKTKEKTELIRSELVKIVKTYNRYPAIGLFERWSAECLLRLAVGAVCCLSFKDIYTILRKSVGIGVCCPDIRERDLEFKILYSLCCSILIRTKEEACIAPNDVLYRQTLIKLRQVGHRVLIVVNVETELYFQAWYENPAADETEMIQWSSLCPCFMKVVKCLDDVNNAEAMFFYEEILEAQSSEEVPPLMIVLTAGENFFTGEFYDTNS